MSSIDNLKTLLGFKVSDGRRKIPVHINDTNIRLNNVLLLLYTDDMEIISIGQFTGGGYYDQEIQIVSRHNDYNKSRSVALSAIEYISKNRKFFANVIYIPDKPPFYTGIDERTGGYTWSFTIRQKGVS